MTSNTKKELSEEERVGQYLGRILANLSEDEFNNLIKDDDKIIDLSMPNDQNYLWSEEDKTQDTKIFDFKKIEGIKFSDPRVKKLMTDDIGPYYNFIDNQEAYFEAEYGLAYLIYKYTKLHNLTPNWMYVSNDVLKRAFFQKFIDNLKLPESCYIVTYRYDNKKTDIGNLWVNFKDIFLYFDGNGAYVIFPPEYKNFSEKENSLGIMLGIIKAYKEPPVVKNKIYIVYKSQYGFDKKDFTLKRIKNINLDTNYNDGFPEVAKDIISKLNNKKKTGLVILHGEPGTGKTTFIRYLAGKLKRNIIFISPDMVHSITEPDFIPFLMDNSDAILILEDAEGALQKRDGSGRSSAVSNILNLTDGLLSDCLNISMVATFNMATKNIDEALLRKGRLLKAYKFDKLSPDRAKVLMDKEGHNDTIIDKPMSLADIYYFEDVVKGNPEAFSEAKRVGFGNN
jgi:energy-coupling factor transporter ATP-binding protein EcfA2